MTILRTSNTRAARRVRWPVPKSSRRNTRGEIRSLVIMVESATLATTIIPVEAAKPPMKTNRASASNPRSSGSARTIMSPGMDAGRTLIPARTIGTMTSEVIAR